MELKVDCSFDKVSKYIETEVLVDGVSVLNLDGTDCAKATAIATINVQCGCSKFVEKAVKIWKLLGTSTSKKISYVQTVRTMSGKTLYMCVIHRDKTTDFLFEMLSRLGIYINDLVIGINSDTHNLYVSNKLLREFKRLKEEGCRMLTMYLYTLAYFMTQSTLLKLDYAYETFSDNVILSKTAYDNLNNIFFSFTNEFLTITINEIPTEDLKSIYIHKTNHSVPSFKYPKPYDIRMALIQNDSNYYYLIFKGDVDTSPFTVIDLQTFTIFTTMDMCYIDLDSSYVTALLQTFEYEMDIRHVSDIFNETPLTKDIKLLANYEDSVENSVVLDYLKRICKGGLYPSFSMLNIVDYDTKDINNLIKTHDFIIEKDKSVADAEAIQELYKDDEYAQKLYSQVQDYYVDFNLRDLTNYLKGFGRPNDTPNRDAIYAMIFTGESGTGKSTAARVIPYKCGIPFVSVNFSVNIEESDLFGTMIPNPNKKTAEDAEFIWQDGIITKAVRNGYCVILEELNFARPGVLGKLNSLLDETRQIDLQTGEIVKAHPYFKIIATCNISYEGTNSFNKALINRFEQCVEFNEMTTKELIEVIKTRTGYTDISKVEKILIVYEALKKYANEQNVSLVVSVRQLLTLFRQGKYCKNAEHAVINILINGAFIEEPEYKEEFLNTILPNIDLSFKL